MVRNFKQANFEYDEAAFNRGMVDALANKPGLTMPEAQETIKKYQQERRAIRRLLVLDRTCDPPPNDDDATSPRCH